ncbi:hypothetical protein AB0J83_49625 [Actinoplanes sp. NPDC049596]|uniref:hypothetical protein n=1 Tax=unclassified Actinoplanes TaxID=2626549 RepID=UPI0034162A16
MTGWRERSVAGAALLTLASGFLPWWSVRFSGVTATSSAWGASARWSAAILLTVAAAGVGLSWRPSRGRPPVALWLGTMAAVVVAVFLTLGPPADDGSARSPDGWSMLRDAYRSTAALRDDADRPSTEPPDAAGRGVTESSDAAGRGVIESSDAAGRGVIESSDAAGRGVTELHVDAYVLTDRADVPVKGIYAPSTFEVGRRAGSWVGLAAMVATGLALAAAGRPHFRRRPDDPPPAGE